ncbi:heparan-alpha-glucosaminide N-acetyltransferase domain-containing protein [Leucobacter sp. UT-8R-CII-1-4]|uniref:heparan-alpha-glucosaminide N-acetyltransferase domain-containing protein n=1 Tax=Leucobacter sp. UT-8R-CII-1-4 TaxID=3040075 RepID=UPI0024A7A899|nr:heparan-alpha-glucosaminide N-acetyltransferase domain-containing protein [Leucobacter sp. UT-8R-CII-1-4]MDI6023602.1 heparan-alpha-glucosaminide N-acetyltransferase domain-containing protein [Leucobacter sp. UT-8R-CII-1-4]
MAVTEQPVAVAPARNRVRYVGVDLARFVAIAGMIAAHLIAIRSALPGVSEPDLAVAKAVGLVSNGAPATLFAVLGGVSIVFATRKYLRNQQPGKAVASVAVRGFALIVLGVLLGFVDNAIVVILAYYGVAMILAAPFVLIKRNWILASIAGVLGLFSGWINASVRKALDSGLEGPHINVEFLSTDPLGVIRALFLTGEYPAVTWLVYLLTGMLVGRLLVASASSGVLGRTAAKLAGVGAAVFVVAQLVSIWAINHLDTIGVKALGLSQEQLRDYIETTGGSGAPPSARPLAQLLAIPHTGSTMDLIRTIALAVFVIGALVWLCDRERPKLAAVESASASPESGSSLPARLLDVVRATGAAPLTIYSAHIVISGVLMYPYFGLQGSAWFGPTEIPWWVVGPGAFALQICVALAFGAVLSATKKRGPLETLLSKFVGLVVR